MSPRIAIVGAGITGLTIAHRLVQHGLDPTVFEASSRPGGAIETVRHEGFIAECGPHTFLNTSNELAELIEELNLTPSVVAANPSARKRFTVKNGDVVALPMSPSDFWESPIYSGAAKLRMFKEPFVGTREDSVDESVASFVRRRLGPEFLDYGVDLLVQGIWAGDPENLSVRHAFGKLFDLEDRHGSLFRGAFAKLRARSNAEQVPNATDALPHMFGFRDGNDVLPAALREELGPRLKLGHTIAHMRSSQLGGWRLDVQNSDGASSETFDHVVTAIPIDVLAEVLGKPVSGRIPAIDRPPVCVVTLAYRRKDVHHPLDGFGMLIPAREPFEIMGSMFTSTLFENRVPNDEFVTLAVFMGGARQREQVLSWTPTRRLEVAQADLRRLLHIDGDPVWHNEALWRQGIPQYEVGYGRVLQSIDSVEKAMPGLTIAGNCRNGVAVPALVTAGCTIADDLNFRFNQGALK